MKYKRARKKKVKIGNVFRIAIFMLILISIIYIIIYNYKLNRSVTVVKQEVVIDNLPEEFEGFTILQVTDLHSKVFGKDESKLANLINEQQYDIIAFTGDMQNTDDKNYDAFLNLIKGIKNKNEMYYVAGNNGPFVFENDGLRFYYVNSEKLKLTETGREFKDLGFKLMDEIYSIKRGDSTLWISENVSIMEFNEKTNNEYNDNDIRIAITHYPMNEDFYERMSKINYDRSLNQNDHGEGGIIPVYDLILAGHYHGGQWRIPFLGAVYITDINGDGWFPSSERVSGLTQWGDYKQYVSRGLGASGDYKFQRFRLFNEPEINLITLTRG